MFIKSIKDKNMNKHIAGIILFLNSFPNIIANTVIDKTINIAAGYVKFTMYILDSSFFC